MANLHPPHRNARPSVLWGGGCGGGEISILCSADGWPVKFGKLPCTSSHIRRSAGVGGGGVVVIVATRVARWLLICRLVPHPLAAFCRVVGARRVCVFMLVISIV